MRPEPRLGGGSAVRTGPTLPVTPVGVPSPRPRGFSSVFARGSRIPHPASRLLASAFLAPACDLPTSDSLPLARGLGHPPPGFRLRLPAHISWLAPRFSRAPPASSASRLPAPALRLAAPGATSGRPGPAYQLLTPASSLRRPPSGSRFPAPASASRLGPPGSYPLPVPVSRLLPLASCSLRPPRGFRLPLLPSASRLPQSTFCLSAPTFRLRPPPSGSRFPAPTSWPPRSSLPGSRRRLPLTGSPRPPAHVSRLPPCFREGNAVGAGCVVRVRS
jgi:hypothetical protein